MSKLFELYVFKKLKDIFPNKDEVVYHPTFQSNTVDEIVQILKDKSNGILKEEDAQEIKKALNLLNSNNASSREEYIAGIKDSFIATKVKLNDLRHNMDLSRISNPTEKDKNRTKRYRMEYRQVLEYLGTVAWEWDKDDV